MHLNGQYYNNPNMTTKNNITSKEIDIVGLIKKVLTETRTLVTFAGVAAIIGIIVALNTQKSYTSTVILAPEISSSGGLPEGISNLASMVGMDIGSGLGNSVDAIYPQIYPDVILSSDFIITLFDIKVKRNNANSEQTYYDHLTKDTKIPFWNYPMIWIRQMFESKDTTKISDTINPFRLTKIQTGVCNTIRANMNCLVDKKTNVITISITDNDPLVAAIMADTLQKKLQTYITEYRTKKARNDLAYAENLFNEAKKQYINAQKEYASYADRNDGLILETYKIKKDDLENDMQLKYNIYTQLTQQLQLAKAKVQEKTPVFTVIQGATVPLQASSTPRSFMVLGFILLGIICDSMWVLYLREFFRRRKLS